MCKTPSPPPQTPDPLLPPPSWPNRNSNPSHRPGKKKPPHLRPSPPALHGSPPTSDHCFPRPLPLPPHRGESHPSAWPRSPANAAEAWWAHNPSVLFFSSLTSLATANRGVFNFTASLPFRPDPPPHHPSPSELHQPPLPERCLPLSPDESTGTPSSPLLSPFPTPATMPSSPSQTKKKIEKLLDRPDRHL